MAKIRIPTSARNKKKDRIGDGKINTIDEMVDEVEQELWKTNPMEALRYESVEKRKKLNWWARFSLSMTIVLTFLFLVWLLFFAELPQESRDLINIMVGAYVAVLAKTTDYWFKDKDDAEVKETQDIHNGNTEDNSY